MPRSYVYILLALGVGLAAGYGLAPGPGPLVMPPPLPPVPVTPSFPPGEVQTMDTLQQRLHIAEQDRQALRARVNELQQQLAALEINEPDIELEPADTDETEDVTPLSGIEALLDAGIGPDMAAYIQERLDAAELEQVYLRDRAMREGWVTSPRFHQELRKHQNTVAELRGEIGDDNYDRLLYASGRPNRVIARDVMLGSAAEQYGIETDDHIIEYAGQRVFTSNDLVSLVSKGEAGVPTLVRVRRADGVHDIYIPRGPLGVRLRVVRVMP